MTDTLITEVQQGIIDQVDSTALDIIIWSYLNNPNNDFMDQDRVETITDATACTIVYDPVPLDQTSAYDTTGTCVYIDTTTVDYIDTTSLWTVEQWKAVYLENTNNDAMISQDKIAYTDSNSPNYPLVDWNSRLFTFDTTSSVDFDVGDSTSDIFIQYAHRTSVPIDGMYIQPGLSGVDSTTGEADLVFYIGYSFNGTDWEYIADGAGIPTIFTNQQDAINQPFHVTYAEAEITPQNVSEIIFTETAIEAKYWRIFFVEGALGPYTASVSHLRFQQIREHGKAVIRHTVTKDRTVGVFSTGDVIYDDSISGAGWYNSATATITAYGVKEQSCQLVGRFWADSTCDVKITFEEYAGASEVIVDSWSLDDRGFITLTDGRDAFNPAADVSEPWVFKYRVYDKSDFDTPAIRLRFSLMTSFRSSQET